MAEVKFTEEDIKSLNELSSTYQRIQTAYVRSTARQS